MPSCIILFSYHYSPAISLDYQIVSEFGARANNSLFKPYESKLSRESIFILCRNQLALNFSLNIHDVSIHYLIFWPPTFLQTETFMWICQTSIFFFKWQIWTVITRWEISHMIWIIAHQWAVTDTINEW